MSRRSFKGHSVVQELNVLTGFKDTYIALNKLLTHKNSFINRKISPRFLKEIDRECTLTFIFESIVLRSLYILL